MCLQKWTTFCGGERSKMYGSSWHGSKKKEPQPHFSQTVCSSCHDYAFYLLIMLWNGELTCFSPKRYVSLRYVESKETLNLWHISIYNDFASGFFFSSFFQQRVSCVKYKLKTNKLQYSILKTLQRMATLWLLYYTVHDSAHIHTLENCTDKQKEAQITSQITFASGLNKKHRVF